MTQAEVREEFAGIIFSYIQTLGFTIKERSYRKGASGFIVFEKVLDNGIKYKLQLTFTSYLEVGPYFNVIYPEIEKVIKKLDKTFAKNQGTCTFNGYFFEVLNPANADGYLHHSAGYPYYKIKEPYTPENIIKQSAAVATELIVPVVERILPITDSLQKADYVLNEKNPLIQGKNRLLTSVLSDPIPLHMINSLLTAYIFQRTNLQDLITKYQAYVKEQYATDNSYVFLLEKVINNLKGN